MLEVHKKKQFFNAKFLPYFSFNKYMITVKKYISRNWRLFGFGTPLISLLVVSSVCVKTDMIQMST